MKYEIIDDMLTLEECNKIIEAVMIQDEWVYDPVINNDGYEHPREHGELVRKVLQTPINPVFHDWDGLKVLGPKVMKYEVGDFVKEHRDRLGMLHSSCYEEGTDLKSKDLMIIPLNSDYKGGELSVDGEVIEQKVGSVIQVAQPMEGYRPMHAVSEVTKGTRFSLVFWNFQ